MNKYLVKFQPLTTFFFGQENKYRKKRKRDSIGQHIEQIEADYFQQSAHFPQQTTILGALRYCLLQLNGQIPVNNPEIAASLVGKQSFHIVNGNIDFGIIKKLSAVFIVDSENNVFYQNPKDLILSNDEKNKTKCITVLSKSKSPIKTSLGDRYYFENYIEKHGLSNFLINDEGNFLPLDYDHEKAVNGVFVGQEKIGITKNHRNGMGKKMEKPINDKSEDEGLYKQNVYKLREGFTFGIVADLDGDFDGKSIFTSMGAEKSPFKVSFQSLDTAKLKVASFGKENSPKLVLLSDAYVSGYNTSGFSMAITETNTFRFITSEMKVGNKYYSSNPLSKQTNHLQRSKKLNLFKRGSVFFFTDKQQMDSFAKVLESEENFYQIGFNNYLTLY